MLDDFSIFFVFAAFAMGAFVSSTFDWTFNTSDLIQIISISVTSILALWVTRVVQMGLFRTGKRIELQLEAVEKAEKIGMQVYEIFHNKTLLDEHKRQILKGFKDMSFWIKRYGQLIGADVREFETKRLNFKKSSTDAPWSGGQLSDEMMVHITKSYNEYLQCCDSARMKSLK